ncbi:MAG: hypothetical protein WCJ59_01825 [bacterium]
MKITICGSIGFYKEMELAKNILVKLGHEVKIPELEFEISKEITGDKKVYFDEYVREHGGMNSFPIDHKVWNVKGGAMKMHFDKIDWADAVLIVNNEKRGIQGYVGGNTLIEIGVAFFLGKIVYILNPVSDELLYRSEILATKPIFIDGDLNKI